MCPLPHPSLKTISRNFFLEVSVCFLFVLFFEKIYSIFIQGIEEVKRRKGKKNHDNGLKKKHRELEQEQKIVLRVRIFVKFERWKQCTYLLQINPLDIPAVKNWKNCKFSLASSRSIHQVVHFHVLWCTWPSGTRIEYNFFAKLPLTKTIKCLW